MKGKREREYIHIKSSGVVQVELSVAFYINSFFS